MNLCCRKNGNYFAMKLLQFFLICPLFFFGVTRAGAVIGGTPVAPPYYAVMVLSDRGSVCTGLVLGDTLVLTAAHCVSNAGKLAVHFTGEGNRNEMLAVSRVAVHPQYLPVEQSYRQRTTTIDLALVQTDRPISGKTAVALSRTRPEKDSLVFIGGFGVFKERGKPDGEFREVALTVVEPYGRGNFYLWLAGRPGTGACDGDSGGPVVFGHELVALVFSTSGSNGANCGRYTQGLLLSTQRDWIDTTAAQWRGTVTWR
jgi:secreted trypsin-like serine protease